MHVAGGVILWGRCSPWFTMHFRVTPPICCSLFHKATGCDVRKMIIDQYMYLLSAPFLAIAAYYLLQIIANGVTEPVLVLMAFAIGLISERIVSAIVEFAKRTLGGDAVKTPADPKLTPAA